MIKGSNVILSINNVNVGMLKVCNINTDVEMKEISDPTSNNACDYKAGYGEWNLEAGTLVGNFDFLTMIGYIKSKEMLTLRFRTVPSSTEQFCFYGQGFIKSIKMQAPIKRLATASIGLQGSGKQTLTTNQPTTTESNG